MSAFFFGHSGSDMEYGAKAAQGMPNLFMDIGGGDATNGYTETPRRARGGRPRGVRQRP